MGCGWYDFQQFIKCCDGIGLKQWAEVKKRERLHGEDLDDSTEQENTTKALVQKRSYYLHSNAEQIYR
jgi:hypothetical protein